MAQRYPALVNRKRMLLQQDNARPHTSKKTIEKIKELDIEVMPHPAYSSDLAPSDFHLFRSMTHFLRGRRFSNDEESSLKMSNRDVKIFSNPKNLNGTDMV